MATQESASQRKGASQTLQAVLNMRNMILAGETAPGERLSEPVMVERLGLSRTPVRAALMRLEQEGLVESIPSGGYAVRAFSIDDINDAIELRGVVEGTAARFAAERGVQPGDLAKMKELLERLDAAAPGLDSEAGFSKYVALNADFHDRLHHMARSPILEKQIERILRMPFASPSAFVDAQTRNPEVLEVIRLGQHQHRAIVEAIELREGARAEAMGREHARIARHNLEIILADEELSRRVPGLSLVTR